MWMNTAYCGLTVFLIGSHFPRLPPLESSIFFDRNPRYSRTCSLGTARLSNDLLSIELTKYCGDICEMVSVFVWKLGSVTTRKDSSVRGAEEAGIHLFGDSTL